MNDDFNHIDDEEPEEGQYCEIKVISYFKGWYLPSCKSWSWLMDEETGPKSHVEEWRPAKEKKGRNGYEYIHSDDRF